MRKYLEAITGIVTGDNIPVKFPDLELMMNGLKG